MEGNLLKIHRQNPASNSRKLKEAIALTLFDLKSNYTGETFSVDTWEKRMGANGYFDFMESYMGNEITGDEMKFSILLPEKDV